MVNVTAVVLSLNEEARIGRCLESLAFAKCVIVIDSYSQDGTREACSRVWAASGRDPGDLVFVQSEWRGFTRARNDSLAWAKTPWTLWVDADEWVTPELAAELHEICDNEPLSMTENVYQMPRLSRFMGREIRHGGWYPDRKARLAKTAACEWRSGPNLSDVHEDLWPRPEFRQQRGQLKGHLGHEPFLSRQEQRQTNLRYSGILAEGIVRKRRTSGMGAPSQAYIAIKVVIKFLENYFFKHGFLDGRPGLMIALGSAQSLAWRLGKVRDQLQNPPQKALPQKP